MNTKEQIEFADSLAGYFSMKNSNIIVQMFVVRQGKRGWASEYGSPFSRLLLCGLPNNYRMLSIEAKLLVP